MASKHLLLTIALSVLITLTLSTIFYRFGDDAILGSSALELEAARLLNQRFNAVSKLENLPDTLEPAEAGLLIHSTVYEGLVNQLMMLCAVFFVDVLWIRGILLTFAKHKQKSFFKSTL